MGNRRLVEDAGSDLDVLALQGRDDIPRGEPKCVQPVRVEPDSHRVVTGPEHGDGADAVDAVQHVRDLDGGVIRNEERVARLVRGIEMHDHHQVGRAFGRGDPDIANVRGDTRLRDRDPVLHLDLRNIEVGAELEGHVNLETAISGRVRGHVDHVRGGDHVRARPGILTADPNHRRRNLWILGDRQPPDGHRAKDNEGDRDDRSEDRPVDEEVRLAHLRFSLNWRRFAGRRSTRKRCSIAAALP